MRIQVLTTMLDFAQFFFDHIDVPARTRVHLLRMVEALDRLQAMAPAAMA